MIRKFARPYAKAALSQTADLDAAQQLLEGLRAFARAMDEVPAIAAAVSNPGIPGETKRATVREIAQQIGVDDLTTRLLDLLVVNYRLPYLGDVVAAVDELVKRRAGVVTARVTSAAQLSDEQVGKLQAVLEKALGKQVELEVDVESGLLGGFVAQVGSRRYDVSLRGQLARMADQMAAAES